MTAVIKDKNIVLGITGGIAAYKAANLIRLLKKAGANVQVILTSAAREFITPVTLSTLSENPVITEFFSANSGEWHSHVKLGIWADLMIIAPATANTLAKMAYGIADNMLLTSYLSTRSKVLVAPAMDFDMWLHPTTRRNIKILEQDGVLFVDPEEGHLASGLIGKGRMAEPEKIFEKVCRFFESMLDVNKESLKGKQALVTAGPTYEKIDPVRFIGNFSSGKMGFAIAEELADRGAEVVLVTGPSYQTITSEKIKRIDVMSAREMLDECEKHYNDCQYAFFSAAVADYRPEIEEESKIKRESMEAPTINLVKNPDIAATLGRLKKNQKNIGFALETDNEEFNAKLKLEKKNLDWIVLNSLKDSEAGFMKDTNKITIFSRDGESFRYEVKSKKDVAKDIIDLVCK